MDKKQNTIDAQEIKHFSEHAASWWEESGTFRILHRMNPLRLQFMIDNLALEEVPTLKGLSILDVGCGGGLLTEPLARLGAQVTGIDATEENILVAQNHAKLMDLEIDYRALTAEALVEEGKTYDIVVSYEVIEHVSDPDAFLNSLTALVKPGGHLFLSTLNRTPQSYLFGILAAEYILGWAPKGTHRWDKFISPQELSRKLEEYGFSSRHVQGLTFSPLTGAWTLGPDVSMNYLLYARKKDEGL